MESQTANFIADAESPESLVRRNINSAMKWNPDLTGDNAELIIAHIEAARQEVFQALPERLQKYRDPDKVFGNVGQGEYLGAKQGDDLWNILVDRACSYVTKHTAPSYRSKYAEADKLLQDKDFPFNEESSKELQNQIVGLFKTAEADD